MPMDHNDTDTADALADAALMIDALAQYAGPEIESHTDRRAWELIDELATSVGRTPAEVLRDAPVSAHRFE